MWIDSIRGWHIFVLAMVCCLMVVSFIFFVDVNTAPEITGYVYNGEGRAEPFYSCGEKPIIADAISGMVLCGDYSFFAKVLKSFFVASAFLTFGLVGLILVPNKR